MNDAVLEARGEEREDGARAEWTGSLAMSCIALFIGSLPLLAAALLTSAFGSSAYYGLFGMVCFAWIALLFHAFGWVFMARAIFEARGTPRLARSMGLAFVASLVAFAAGLATAPSTFPFPVAWYLVLITLMPFVPSIWAIVVVCHAALFLVALRARPDGPWASSVRTGSVFLLLVAIIGLGIQLSGRLSDPSAFLAASTASGLTAVGYALAAWGWRRAWLEPASPPTNAAARAQEA